MHTISFLLYLLMSFLPPYCFASVNMMSMVLPRSSIIIPRWSSILKVVMKFKIIMEPSDSNESERDKEQVPQNTNSNSNSASVTVTGPTGVTGPRVIKFGYKEFTVKCQRWHAGCRNCNKHIQDKVNVTSAFTK